MRTEMLKVRMSKAEMMHLRRVATALHLNRSKIVRMLLRLTSECLAKAQVSK